MPVRCAIAVLFLLVLALVAWPWLDFPDHGLDGWLLAAYALVFTVLGAYRAWLGDREREALRAASELHLRLGENDDRRLPPRPFWLGLCEQLAPPATLVGLVLGLLYAPTEKTMGQVQRIFYIHVPSAWNAGLAFTVVFAASIAYLATRSAGADRVARGAAEVGVVFTSLVLVSGPIWAKPVWGIWWTWDARLTLTFVLWLVYLGYLMLRAYVPDPDRRATLAAVVGVLGLPGVAIDYFAIRWWRTQHPQPVMGGGGRLEAHMLRAFQWSLLAFTVLFLALVALRVHVLRLEDENEARERRLA